MKSSPIIFVACLMLTGPSSLTVHAQVAEIAGSAATSLVLKQLFADLTNMINKARDDGDYLLARAGVEAKNAMDAWQKANDNLLDKAFSELDKSSRENFARAHQLIAAANTPAANRLETVQQITENANQIIESIPLRPRQTYVLRFSPRIQPPQAEESFTIRIRGVNLDKGDPNLHLPKGDFAKRNQPGPLEAQFIIPTTAVQRDPSKILTHSFKLTYSTPPESWFDSLFGKRQSVTREIPIVVLPITMGSFEIDITRKFNKRIEKAFTRDLGQFKATNSRQYKTAPPDDGWKWDLSKPLQPQQGDGKAGRCEGADMNASSENGIAFFAHLDEIKNWEYPRGAPGYVNCALKGTVYKMEDATETLPTQNGTLSWIADKQITLPPDTDSFTLRVKTFDGRERVLSGTGSDQFFNIRREPQALVITPTVPEDIGI